MAELGSNKGQHLPRPPCSPPLTIGLYHDQTCPGLSLFYTRGSEGYAAHPPPNHCQRRIAPCSFQLYDHIWLEMKRIFIFCCILAAHNLGAVQVRPTDKSGYCGIHGGGRDWAYTNRLTPPSHRGLGRKICLQHDDISSQSPLFTTWRSRKSHPGALSCFLSYGLTDCFFFLFYYYYVFFFFSIARANPVQSGEFGDVHHAAANE